MTNESFNKYQIVLLDGRHDVVVIEQTPNKLLTKIKADPLDSDETGWEVMTDRLSKIQPL